MVLREKVNLAGVFQKEPPRIRPRRISNQRAVAAGEFPTHRFELHPDQALDQIGVLSRKERMNPFHVAAEVT
jgi:hypothetical protein